MGLWIRIQVSDQKFEPQAAVAQRRKGETRPSKGKEGKGKVTTAHTCPRRVLSQHGVYTYSYNRRPAIHATMQSDVFAGKLSVQVLSISLAFMATAASSR